MAKRSRDASDGIDPVPPVDAAVMDSGGSRMSGPRTMSLVGMLDTKREHYLPRFFLQRFVNDKGTMAVVSRMGRDGRPRLQRNMRVENIALRNALYETAYPGDRDGSYYFPNPNEKSLSYMEDFLSRELRWTLDVALTMRPSDRLDDEDLSRIMMFVSLFVPHIVSRSPRSVDCAIDNAPHVLEAMREAGIGSSGSLREACREVFPDEKLDETLVFDPRSLSEYVSLRLQMIPGGEAFESSPLCDAMHHLGDCSLLVMTTSVGHPFIGLDAPIRAALPDECVAWYYPLSSRVAVMLADDGRHTFEKRSISYRLLKELNGVARNDGNWGLVFCERPDYLDPPYVRDM